MSRSCIASKGQAAEAVKKSLGGNDDPQMWPVKNAVLASLLDEKEVANKCK